MLITDDYHPVAGRRDRDSGVGMWSGDSELSQQPDDTPDSRPSTAQLLGAPELSRGQADARVRLSGRYSEIRRSGDQEPGESGVRLSGRHREREEKREQRQIQRSVSFSVLRECPEPGGDDEVCDE